MVRGLVVIVLLVMTGCAAQRGEPFTPEVVDPSRAVVYVFREPGAGLRSKPVKVFINQEPAGTLLPGQYLCRTVPAAESLVRVEGDSSSARPVRLSPGDAAYLQVVIPAIGPVRPTLELIESEPARRALSNTTRTPS
jgi:hypothetical protein